MKRIAFFILHSLIFIGCATAQPLMRDVFAAMPDSVQPMVTKNNRLDCIDFIENNMEARVRNKADEYVTLEALTANYARFRTSDVSFMEMKILPTSDSTYVLCVVTTAESGEKGSRRYMADSNIRFLATDWSPLPRSITFHRPVLSAFFADGKVPDTPRALPLMQMSLSPDENTLTLTLQPCLWEQEERETSSGQLQPVVMQWNGINFTSSAADISTVDISAVDTLGNDSLTRRERIRQKVDAGFTKLVSRKSVAKLLRHKKILALMDQYGIDSIRNLRDLDNLFAVHYQKKGHYDTLYLARPTQRFTARARMNVSGSGLTTEGVYHGMEYVNHLNTPNRITTSIAFAYRGIGIALSFNPAKLKGGSNTNEFYINYYTNRFGVELALVNSKDYSGWCSQLGNTIEISSDMLKTRTLNISGYYAFNHHKFSYPAAFTQSYIQRRSAGSWMLAAAWMSGNIETITSIHGSEQMKLHYGSFGIGGGYGYNWVIGKHWMLHGSALPTLAVLSFNNLHVGGEKEKIPYTFPEFIFTERVAAIYQVRHNQFASLTFVAYHSLHGSKQSIRLTHTKWRLRVSYGFRF